MNKQLLGIAFNRLAIALYALAGIVYAATKVGGIPFWFIGAGTVSALISIILLHGNKASLKKPYRILNYLFIILPALVFVGLIVYSLLLGATLRNNLPG